MKVITLNPKMFKVHCRRLEDLVAESFQPDLVVGVADGGVNVADLIFREVPHIKVKCERPSTPVKKKASLLMKVVRQLPLWIRNIMRRAEAGIVSFRKPVSAPDPVAVADSDLVGRTKILVVDDAVDSGRTMNSVVHALAQHNENCEIRTAVITMTTDTPVLKPDFTLYDDNTLIRFPWSQDYRREK